MKTVNITDLYSELSGCLQYVRNGEEVVIHDRSIPVARLIPCERSADLSREADLVASAVIKMPESEIDWSSFFLIPSADLSRETALEAVLLTRGDR